MTMVDKSNEYEALINEKERIYNLKKKEYERNLFEKETNLKALNNYYAELLASFPEQKANFFNMDSIPTDITLEELISIQEIIATQLTNLDVLIQQDLSMEITSTNKKPSTGETLKQAITQPVALTPPPTDELEINFSEFES